MRAVFPDNLITSPNGRTHSLGTRRVNLIRLVEKVCWNKARMDRIERLGGRKSYRLEEYFSE